MPITDVRLRNSKPQSKAYRIHDERGLYIEVSPKGSKLWRFKYRYQGREKLLALGRWPEVSLREARDLRDAHRLSLRQGEDPGEARKPTHTFKSLATEWLDKFGPSWSPNHLLDIRRSFETYIYPVIGQTPPDAVTAPLILKCLRAIEHTGALALAHRMRSRIGAVMRYGVATGICERDPSRDLQGALARPQSGHFQAITTVPELQAIYRTIQDYKGLAQVRVALQLAPLLFARRSELIRMRWDQVDFEAREWRYRVTKTNIDHIVPLAPQALALIDSLRPLTGRSAWVFQSPMKSGQPMRSELLLRGLREAGISGSVTSLHGFRASARTILDEVFGFRPEIIEAQLSHSVRDPLGRAYNRTTFLAERYKMMDFWADVLVGK